MLKNILNLNGVQQLNKQQQILLKGGSGESHFPGENDAMYKCCWTGTDNCSACVVTPKPSCVSGATAVLCN